MPTPSGADMHCALEQRHTIDVSVSLQEFNRGNRPSASARIKVSYERNKTSTKLLKKKKSLGQKINIKLNPQFTS